LQRSSGGGVCLWFNNRMIRRAISPASNTEHRAWQYEAMRKLEADFNRSSDTHLEPLPVPGCPDVHLYFKDESTHPTGSLKHRLARSLFLYALANNWITPKRQSWRRRHPYL
jgi:hypothetical protein